MEHIDPDTLAISLDAELRALPMWRAPLARPIIKKYAKLCQKLTPGQMLTLTHLLIDRFDQRGDGYELLSYHHPAMRTLGESELEALGQGINSWWSVDSFARLLSGPVWAAGQVSDEVIHAWAVSPDLWWRRAALVSTVALNMRSHGGKGDAPRTFAVCRMLACDPEDMVVKALSWALRELVWVDRAGVESFLAEYDACLAGRVKREVRNKLDTGLKTPKK
jgi:3-methyladenine DNA glycosylase AlkD